MNFPVTGKGLEMNVSRILAPVAFVVLTASPALAIPSISIEPGDSPAGGYLPLSVFGIAPTAGMGDESIVNFTTPSFVFGGETWGSVGISSNGYLKVGGGTSADSSFANTALPDASSPKNILAPFWTDLDFDLGGAFRIATLTDGVNTWLVSDWDGVHGFGSPEAYSFQIWIGINGIEDITFTYGPLGALPADLTVGAQDASGTVGDTWYYNGTGTAPFNGLQLRVSSLDLPVDVPEPAALALFGLGVAGLGLARRRKAA